MKVFIKLNYITLFFVITNIVTYYLYYDANKFKTYYLNDQEVGGYKRCINSLNFVLSILPEDVKNKHFSSNDDL